MNRTDRLLAIVLELQGKGRQRAEDLATTFETSKRTIYRDIQALGEAGVPVMSMPGLGYSLMKGYFLPPLSFSTDEATMLLLGGEFMAQHFDAQYRAAAQSANRKIEGVLPEKLRDEVHYLQNNILFISIDTLEHSVKAEMLRHIRSAILDRMTLRFNYHTRRSEDGRSAQSVREVDPYKLVYFSGAWHLMAYCHTRLDIRNFRIDRIENLEVLAKTFTRPAERELQEVRQSDSRNILVRALFDQEVSRWVHESRSYYATTEEETSAGLLVTMKVRNESDVLQWLLSWGSRVRVLEPESLRNLLVEEAEKIIQKNRQISSS